MRTLPARAPWARHNTRFTVAFEDTAAWLAARTSASAVTGLLRIAWRSVTGIVARVVDAALVGVDRLAVPGGPRRTRPTRDLPIHSA
ncbi:transposase family protein [Micromonospora sp. NPDC047548]|uniref:transposase family protein n=1 Tax=Micromonospora sp. NPDC047548 TaxID=3155624 RepID=UPI0034093355